MARTKTQKKEILGELGGIISKAKSLVFVNFHGLKVADAFSMRKSLRAKEVGFFIAKKSLLKRALDEQKYKGEIPSLDGEIGLAFGIDPVAPASGVYEFQKKLKDQVTIMGGVFEGEYRDKAGMTAIATIPPMDTLRGMFVNVINSPIQGFVMALNEISKKKTA
jgi:large subunit ribosomal protein L10